MFACVLYVCYAVMGSVLGSETTRCGDWLCSRTQRCIIRLGLYSVKILHYAVIVCLLVCCMFAVYCMFACVLYGCYAVMGLYSVQKLRDAAIGSVLSRPDAVLFDWVILCTNPTLCSNCMFACVLYVCLCVVWLLCGDWVCTRFRNYEMRRLGLCSPNPTLYYSIGSLLCTNLTVCGDCMFALCVVCLLCIVFLVHETTRCGRIVICALQTRRCIIRLGLYSVKILHYAAIVCLLVYCMFACVLYGCYAVIGSVLGSETTRCGDWICALQTRRCIIRLGLYSVKILHYAVIVCLLVCCMFACVLYVCYAVIGSVLGSETTRCGDWICALQTRRCIIRLGLYSVQILHYAVIVCLLVYCMFACVLYVCLCVVCLLCGDWVCTRFRNYEMRRLDLCSPNPTLYYSIGSYSVKILQYAVIVCLLCIVCLFVCCMFAMR